jgi:hypothetical protein
MRNGLWRINASVSPLTTIRFLIISVAFAVAGCRHRIPGTPPQYDLLYGRGLEAFRLATPVGYRDAIDAFRQASTLIPSRCEYKLHLAESLLFLAQEQQINWEENAPSVSEAASVIDAIPSNGNCSGFSEFLFRVRALRFLFDPSEHSAALEMANQAVELDPNDAMNWLVLFQVNPADPRMPINRALELAADLALVSEIQLAAKLGNASGLILPGLGDEVQADLAHAYAGSGRRREAVQILDNLKKTSRTIASRPGHSSSFIPDSETMIALSSGSRRVSVNLSRRHQV